MRKRAVMEERDRLNQLDDDSDDEAEEEEEEEETDKGSTGKQLVLAMQNMIGGIADLATDALSAVANKAAKFSSAVEGIELYSEGASSLVQVVQKLFNPPLSSSHITFTSSCPFNLAGTLTLQQNVSLWAASFDFLTSLENSVLSSSTLGMSQHTDVVTKLAVSEAGNGGSSQFCFEETCVGLKMMNVLSAFAYLPPLFALSLRLLCFVAHILERDPEKPLFTSFSSSEMLPSYVYSSTFSKQH
ncbi:uncharacterized protein MONOS_16175 [Monocercomonoides exilis]|uniref:uncharacterized protein n=1 Tax=Monocercomonoides exilis TaxID=2049356 RepID=UPI00355A42B2|nr:hypothetical protein MONOS_16175 [Monocercomonoides exilis]|eukprot:MONOS_16175.1-p1 / transcript=MONOS_16175.1 / gene=MONOS_16175 / organism=Monocercomonoides_exilis_PA203 / gene_product=unspecified product / transcript_product=unspecified product / location=Mono_scaffold01544:3262-4839(+) / protein_length=244 / sequence_SO=supercontig / SO=protein_coding / is_pseudo=false